MNHSILVYDGRCRYPSCIGQHRIGRSHVREGRKKCYNCHRSQGESWVKTLHAKAIESLKPNTRKEAKLKAKLDPKKDYTKDKDCIGCHVDGWSKVGGYTIEEPEKFLSGIGCESCHGAGSYYRKLH